MLGKANYKVSTGVSVKSYKVVDIESSVQKKDDQWAIVPVGEFSGGDFFPEMRSD